MDDKLNILYLSYDGMTDPLGQSQVLPYIIELTKKGYHFTLISFEKQLVFEARKKTIELICAENNIDWHPLPYTKSPPILSTIKDVYLLRKTAYSLHQQKKFSIIHCRGYITALVGRWMKQKFNTRFLFDMRGFWANEKVDAGAWRLSNPVFSIVYNFFKKKELQYFSDADHSICLTQAGKDEIYTWPKIDIKNTPITVIPCCSDTSHFDFKTIDDSKKELLQQQLSISPQDFILSYLGSIGTWYMLEEMLDFFVELKKVKANARFLFITGDEHSLIMAMANERNIKVDDLIIRKAERTDVPYFISLSSLSVFFIRPTYSKIASSPTKQGELMAMGVPIICNDGVGDTAAIVRKYNSGIVLKEFNKESYQVAINQFFDTQFDPSKLQAGAEDFFSLEKGAANYFKIYKSIF